MLKSYLKLAWKVLLRRKFFTFISLFGIAFTLVVLTLVTALLDNVVAAYPPETKHASTVGINFASLRGEHWRRNGFAGYAMLDKYARDLPNVKQMAVASMPNGVFSYLNGPAAQVVSEADRRRLLADPRLPVPRGRALYGVRRARSPHGRRHQRQPRASASSAGSRRSGAPSRPTASGSPW